MRKIKSIIKAIGITSLLAISFSCMTSFAATTADHHSEIVWGDPYTSLDGGKRWVEANTQAYYVAGNGTKTKVASYTRARFEYPWWLGGGSYCDSGRQWGYGTGKSYATSGKEQYKNGESGCAKSYWGTE